MRAVGSTGLSSTEAARDILMRTAGVFSNLLVNVSVNSNAATSTLQFRKNAANANQVISVGGTLTGAFEDTTNTDTVAAGDKFVLQVTAGSAATLTIRLLSLLFDATTDAMTKLMTFDIIYATASTTVYAALTASDQTATEANVKCRMRKAGVFKNMSAYVRTTRATASTVRIRKNGANGNLTVSLTGGTSGWFEDTTNTDTVTAGEDWNYSLTTGTGVDSLSVAFGVEFVSTASEGILLCAVATPIAITDNTNRFFYIAGKLVESTTETGAAGVQTKARFAFTLSQLTILVTQNDVSSASTCMLRKNAADSTLTVSITGNTTGVFSDTTNTELLTATDQINTQVTVPAVAGTHTVMIANIVVSTLGSAPQNITKSLATETVTVGETIARKKGLTRTISETKTIGESVVRKKGLTRALTETKTIGESVTRKKGLTRALSETVTVTGGTLARVLGKVRAIIQTTSIGELLARRKGLSRSLATQTVVISEQVVKTKGLPRAPAAETVTSGESVTRSLGKNRTISQTTAIGELLARIIGRSRAPAAQTVTVSGGTVARQTGKTRVAGVQRSIALGGGSEFIDLGNQSLWSNWQKLTYSMWIYADPAGAGTSRYMLEHNNYYDLYIDIDDVIYADVWKIEDATAWGNGFFTHAVWHHIIVEMDLTLLADNINIFVDNNAGTPWTGNVGETYTGTDVIRLGDINGNALNGKIKDFRLWKGRILNSTEKAKVMNNDPTAPTPDYWLPMQEGSGNPVDVISGTLIGTLTNGAAWAESAPPVWTYETTPSGDSVTRKKGLSRSIIQSTTIGELLTRIKGVVRAISQTVIVSEDVQTQKGKAKTLEENTTIGESVTRSKGTNRSLPENTLIGEILTRIKGLTRAIIDSVTITEDLTKTKGLPRSPAAENTTIGEAVNRSKGSNRTLPENVASGESVTRSKGASRSLPESVPVTEDVQRAKGISRLINETVTIAEQIARALGKVRSLIETVIISENLAAEKVAGERNRGITETVPVGESVTRSKGSNRSITENVIINELVEKVKGVVKSITESVIVGGTVERMKGLARAIIQTVIVNGTVTRKKEANRTISQSVDISEDLQKQRGFARIISETVSVFDSVTRSMQKVRSIIQTVVVTGTVSMLKAGEPKNVVRAITETVPVSELLTRMKGIHREIGEVVGSIIDFMREDHGPIDGLMCALLKQNWVIQNPAQHEINWSSWYTGDDDISIHCGPVTMIPRPVNIPWDLFDYDSYCMVNVFVTDITGNNGQPRLDRIRKQIEDTINGNPNALDANGIDMIKIDSIFSREDSSSDYKDNYKSDIFRLIIRINLKHIKKF